MIAVKTIMRIRKNAGSFWRLSVWSAKIRVVVGGEDTNQVVFYCKKRIIHEMN